MTNELFCLCVDVAMLLIVLLSCIIGAIRGMIAQLFSFGSKITAFIGSCLIYKRIGSLIDAFWLRERTISLVATKLGSTLEETNIAQLEERARQLCSLLQSFHIEIPVQEGSVEQYFNVLVESIGSAVSIALANAIGFVVSFFVIRLCVLLIGKILNGVFKLPVLKPINRIGGLLVGLVSGIVVCFVLSLFLPAIVSMIFADKAYDLSCATIYSWFARAPLVVFLELFLAKPTQTFRVAV